MLETILGIYHKEILFSLFFFLLHLIVFYNLRQLQLWMYSFNFNTMILKRLFFKLRVKIYVLWIFLIIWIISKFLQLWFIAKICKACSSFVFCLILGDFLCLACIIILKKLVKNLSKLYPLIQKLVLLSFTLLGCVVAANNLGYSVSGFLATLGIGGAAIAFASQNTLSNIWGAISILLDQPFKEGDWIRIGNKVYGQVESIGLRSTRLRTEKNTLIIIPNNTLTNEYIENSFSKKL